MQGRDIFVLFLWHTCIFFEESTTKPKGSVVVYMDFRRVFDKIPQVEWCGSLDHVGCRVSLPVEYNICLKVEDRWRVIFDVGGLH